VIRRQFLRSGTSPAANYRAACRAGFAADFISKISVVAEEAAETLFWLELLVKSELKGEFGRAADERVRRIVKIFSASLATAKRNR
jgi:four helix bundle protein